MVVYYYDVVQLSAPEEEKIKRNMQAVADLLNEVNSIEGVRVAYTMTDFSDGTQGLESIDAAPYSITRSDDDGEFIVVETGYPSDEFDVVVPSFVD